LNKLELLYDKLSGAFNVALGEGGMRQILLVSISEIIKLLNPYMKYLFKPSIVDYTNYLATVRLPDIKEEIMQDREPLPHFAWLLTKHGSPEAVFAYNEEEKEPLGEGAVVINLPAHQPAPQVVVALQTVEDVVDKAIADNVAAIEAVQDALVVSAEDIKDAGKQALEEGDTEDADVSKEELIDNAWQQGYADAMKDVELDGETKALLISNEEKKQEAGIAGEYPFNETEKFKIDGFNAEYQKQISKIRTEFIRQGNDASLSIKGKGEDEDDELAAELSVGDKSLKGLSEVARKLKKELEEKLKAIAKIEKQKIIEATKAKNINIGRVKADCTRRIKKEKKSPIKPATTVTPFSALVATEKSKSKSKKGKTKKAKDE